MKVRVNITQDDIDNGQQYHGYSCPFALALARETNMRVESCCDAAYLTADGWNTFQLPLPSAVGEWIKRFDKDKSSVEPVTFELDLARAKKITPISSSTEKLMIEVMREDIDAGEQDNYDCSPVALALKRVFEPEKILHIDRSGFLMRVGEQPIRVPFPQHVVDWLDHFNERRASVLPFAFYVEIPIFLTAEVPHESSR